MSEVIYYVALPFVPSDDGIAPGEAAECFSANAAVMRAEVLSRKPGHVGAIAFSRSGDRDAAVKILALVALDRDDVVLGGRLH